MITLIIQIYNNEILKQILTIKKGKQRTAALKIYTQSVLKTF